MKLLIILDQKMSKLRLRIKSLLMVTTFVIVGCQRNTCTIPHGDYKLVPYTGHEILIFRANNGQTDTIFLQGVQKFFSPIHQWDFPIKECEHYRVISRRSDPNVVNGKGRYLDSLSLITLVNDGQTKIEIEFTAKNAWFYSDKIFTKKEFLSIRDTTILVGSKKYSDVLALRPNLVIEDKNSENSEGRPNSIIKLYWSRKNGVVRYDKDKNEFWELIDKQ